MTTRIRVLLIAVLCLVGAGCGTLPDTHSFLSARYAAQAARFESARGPLSKRQADAIVAQLKRSAGNLEILDRQIALEEQIVGSPLVVGNRVTLLQDGPETYEAMLAAIRRATDHIQMETYIFEDDDVGRVFREALRERQASGVDVNFIYDSVGTMGTPKSFFEPLVAAGARVVEFNPVNPLLPWRLNHRDHRKLLIVDGRTAFIGGINISNVYSSGSSVGGSGGSRTAARQGGWRDTQVQIDGPVVREFQRLFIETWTKQKGPALPPRDYFPATIAPQGKDIVRAIGSTADEPFSQMYLTLISAITNAERTICIANAYFVPDPQLVRALLDAAARGVDVRLLLPGVSDFWATHHAGRSHYATLLRGGVKIYERRGALLHAKTAVIDGVWSVVGSSNLDWRSAIDNDEIEAVILGHDFGAQMRAAFARDLDASDRIELAQWERRSLWSRTKEWTARLWERLL